MIQVVIPSGQVAMAEADFYQLIKERLKELFVTQGKEPYLEITAKKGPSEKIKQKIPQHREIVFVFLKKKPDILGFVERQYSNDLITVEIKEKIGKLDDVYQAKLYKEVFDARYGFLITMKPIPEEIKRLCKNTFSILHSSVDSIYRFLVIGQFDKENGQFVDWFEENPFEKESYWK
jgi:hypothetical protein